MMEYNQINLIYVEKIFIEFDLIIKNGEYYIVKENVIKTDLQKSSTYVQLEEKKKIIDLIYYDYNSHIKTYFKQLMEA